MGIYTSLATVALLHAFAIAQFPQGRLHRCWSGGAVANGGAADALGSSHAVYKQAATHTGHVGREEPSRLSIWLVANRCIPIQAMDLAHQCHSVL